MDREQRLIKCVVWDLDNTLWPGIAVESPLDTLPQPDAGVLAIMAELEARGIVNSVASRNDPSLGKLLTNQPSLAGKLIAPQISWEPKSHALRRIAEKLNIGLDALAFVDDSPYERAEVAYMLPQVVVLSPDEVRAAMENAAFKPHSLTKEGAQRADMYRAEEQRRVAEEGFAGSRTDFLLSCDMRLSIAPATDSDLDRIAELTERTHQLNSTGQQYTREELKERLGSNSWLVPVASLTDRFGDYGTIGAALVDCGMRNADCGLIDEKSAFHIPHSANDFWLAELIMLSCRVEGRGIPAALLRWIMGEAQRFGIKELHAVYRVNERNLPMRLLFRQMGFEVVDTGHKGQDRHGLILASRDLSEPLPPYPEWLHINTQTEAAH